MIETILFDLDGTIIDTNELIIQSFLHVFKDSSRDEIIPHMGKTLGEQLQILSGQEEVEDLVKAYRAYNVENHDALIGDFPYVKEVIEALHDAGIKMGIVTTKMRKTSLRGLDRLGITDYMDAIVTIDDVEHAKPHPEPVLKAMSIMGANPAATMMVGDSAADIQAANSAGVISTAVAWSLKGVDVLKAYEPKHIIYDMRDLLPLAGIKRDLV